MKTKIGVGLLGLGTVGSGILNILENPEGRHPLLSDIEIIRIAVKDLQKKRSFNLATSTITNNPKEVVNDPKVNLVVEVLGGIEPARSLILEAIANKKSVVTANKAVIARHGEEIKAAAKANNVYVLIEGAVGGGIPIIEPIKKSLGANQIQRISGVINGTTNYILSEMSKGDITFKDVLNEAQKLGYAEADPKADVEGLDAADKIAILTSLAFGGHINRSKIPTEGISKLESIDINYAHQLGYVIKLLAVAEQSIKKKEEMSSLPLAVWVNPTLVPNEHPLASVNGVNNAILLEGNPIGQVMFYGPGAGSGPTASAVVADILNIAGMQSIDKSNQNLDPLLSADSWRNCHLINEIEIVQKNYLRFCTKDCPGVIGRIGNIFGDNQVSLESIIQFDSCNTDAEIVVITHEVKKGQILDSLNKIKSLKEVKGVKSLMSCL